MRLFHCLAAAAALCLAAAPAAASAPAGRGASFDEIFSEPYPAEIREAVDEVRALMLQPGDHVEGWDQGGLDPRADLRAAGADSHFLMVLTGPSNGVGILTDRPIEDFLPEDWVPIGSFGPGTGPGRESYWEILPFSRRFVTVARDEEWRVNDGFCTRELPDARIYDRTGGPLSDEDEETIAIFVIVLLAVRDETVCTRYDGDRADGYDVRYFFPDGRLIPALDAEPSRLLIVPAGPVGELIGFSG